MASMDEGSAPSFMDHFSCTICFEILEKPKQCEKNEHHFCESCITQHLERSSTCPVCKDELTLETLRPPSRVIVGILSQLKKPRCKYSHRGCKENVKLEDLVSHHEVCGFSPVTCSNEGCDETVNKQDLVSHEEEHCKLRKVMCDQCHSEMTFIAFEMHPCLIRSEVDEMKASLKEIQEQVKTLTQAFKELKDPLRNANVSQSSLVFVAGGYGKRSKKSFEVFNWSTKTWTIYEDVLFFDHFKSFCFPYNNKMMVCGGKNSEKMEYVDIKDDPHTAFVFPATVTRSYSSTGKGVLCKEKVFCFYDGHVCATDLDNTPCSAKVMIDLNDRRYDYGLECFGTKIVIGGGNIENNFRNVITDRVEQYDVSNNTLKKMVPLPYAVNFMATVRYKDNIVFIGGEDDSNNRLSSVFMYNVTTQQSKRLPSMLEERVGCAAAMIGKVIVVMGGLSQPNGSKQVIALNTVEYHVLGQPGWKKLPNMHLARYGATASAQI